MTEQARRTRRDFLKRSATVLAASAAAPALTGVHVAGSDVLRVGLIGCGGRGTGAAAQAVSADPGAKLVAIADAFEDRIESSLANLLKQEKLKGKIDVPSDRRFTGFDCHEKLLASGVDVALLCTPPHFRPMHLKAAVAAGCHVFAEKPVAVDAPGVRSVLATCDEAKKKSLSICSGLCLRHSYGFQETVKRIHKGAIGRITSLEANDYRGPIWLRPRQPGWTDMHWQMRNWYYFTWLSGDFNVEQHVHFLDVCAWIMGGRYPKNAVGMGGRSVRTGPEYGNIYDHHSVVYEYDDGAKLYANTRQMPGCYGEMSARATGTKGKAQFIERRGGLAITTGDAKWVYDGPENDIYQTEHDVLFAAIRGGRPINNGDYMSKSTLLAILGRMATYTGQKITWEMAMASKEDLRPKSYAWGEAPKPAIAVPGVTTFA